MNFKSAPVNLCCLLALAASACTYLQDQGTLDQPVTVVYMPDWTGSVLVSPDRYAEILRAVVRRLPRGSGLRVVPIVCDHNVLLNRKVQIQIGDESTPYQDDVRKELAEKSAQFVEWAQELKGHTRCTDVNDSLAVAADFLRWAPAGHKRLLIVLSDFVNNGRTKFPADPMAFANVSVLLGPIPNGSSSQIDDGKYRKLLEGAGATVFPEVVDGLGMVELFMQQNCPATDWLNVIDFRATKASGKKEK